MMSTSRALLIVGICALCTFATRVLPFLLFRNKKGVPPIVQYLGKSLPYIVMPILVVYCMRGISFASLSSWLPSLLAVGVTAGVHVWKRNNLISIAAGTIAYMLLVQGVFG